MRYRPDIDGLRALAVIPVLLFHAGIGAFSGGYVGVDIFFVISGFLITGIILLDIDKQKFSVVDFYDRRIRRIFPALCVVFAACFVAGAILLLPTSFSRMSQAMVSSMLFVSNIYFYKNTGYFEGNAETNPLLHTWSLSVEEQFYVFFPIFLFVASKYFKRHLVLLLWVTVAISFAISAWGAVHSPIPTFYLLPTRAWELLVGSLLAIGAIPAVRSGGLREGLAAAGLAAILAAVFLFSPRTVFPGAAAALPVLGAAALIHAGEGTFVGRLLASRPTVFVGLISYSLYLWHWPIIVFAKQYLGTHTLTLAATLAAIAASVLLATLSWRFVERPFRNRAAISRRQVFQAGFASIALFCGLGAAGFATKGWPQRYAPEIVAIDGFAKAYSPERSRCHSNNDKVIPPAASCAYGADATPRYAIWGDSHAVELAWALGSVAERNGEAIIQLSSSACPPVIGFTSRSRPQCAGRNADVLAYLKGARNIETVFLIARYDGELNTAADEEMVTNGLHRTVEGLASAGKKVVLVYAIPALPGQDVPQFLAQRAARAENPSTAAVSREEALAKTSRSRRILDGIDDALIAGRIHPEDALCDDRKCWLFADGAALYFDDNHPSIYGARRIADRMEYFFQNKVPVTTSANAPAVGSPSVK